MITTNPNRNPLQLRYFDVPPEKAEDVINYLVITDRKTTISTAANNRIGVFDSELSDLTIENIIRYLKPMTRTNLLNFDTEKRKQNTLECRIPPQYENSIALYLSSRDPDAEISMDDGTMRIKSYMNLRELKRITKHPERYQAVAMDKSINFRRKASFGERMSHASDTFSHY